MMKLYNFSWWLTIFNFLGFTEAGSDEFLKFVNSSGYCGEAHEVKTNDGYILKLHRIVPQSKTKKVPIFLQHGIIATSGDWVISGKSKSLAFFLSDNGYEVWLGNVRGNKYSLKHETLSWRDQKFWDFSFHEMGVSDLPAMIDYTRNTTKSEKIILIAHSQGGTASLIFLSSLPKYNDVVLQAHLLAPASFMQNVVSKYIKPLVTPALDYFKIFKNYDVFVNNKRIRQLIASTVEEFALCPKNLEPCKLALKMVCGFNKFDDEYDWKMFDYHWKHVSEKVSAKQLVHYAQLVQSKRFRQFDNYEENLATYHSSTPPDYKLNNIKTSVYLHAGECDAIVGIEDVEHLNDELPNVQKFMKYENYNHVDLVYGKNARKDIYNGILESINNEV